MKSLFPFFLIFVVVLTAQNQEGSVAIAEQIKPASEEVVDNFTQCVVKLTATGLKPDAAVEACTKVAKVQAKMVSDVSDDASGAAKASRPVVLAQPCSYGRRCGGYYSRGYSYGGRYGGGIIISTARAERRAQLAAERRESRARLASERSARRVRSATDRQAARLVRREE